MTPQQLQHKLDTEVKPLLDDAFYKRLKKTKCDNIQEDSLKYVRGKFFTVLPHYGFNTLGITKDEFISISGDGHENSYFDLGVMLNCVMGASFEKNGVSNGAEIINHIAILETLQDSYNKTVEAARKAAQREVKTKFELTNDPLSKYL